MFFFTRKKAGTLENRLNSLKTSADTLHQAAAKAEEGTRKAIELLTTELGTIAAVKDNVRKLID